MFSRNSKTQCAFGLMMALVASAAAPAVGQTEQTRAPARVPAFEGAEGFGAMARGGRGGAVLYVTSLADYDDTRGEAVIPGTLRWALEEMTGPRNVLFRVGGTIPLKRRLIMVGEEGSYVTLAGQTAPGDGIQLTRYGIIIGNGAHDVVIRYLRIRPGADGQPDPGLVDGITILGESGEVVHDIMVDHCSFEWALDENGGVGDAVENVTFQWCIFGEGATYGYNDQGGGNSSGMLLSGERGLPSDEFLTIHHCLFTGNKYRNPYLTQNGGMVDLVNNLIRNFDAVGTEVWPLYEYSPRANIVGNVYEDGVPGARPIVVRTHEGTETAPESFFVADNLSEFTPELGGDDWNIMGQESRNEAIPRSKQRSAPWPVAPEYAVTVDSPDKLVDALLSDVGATLPSRDGLDARLVTEAVEGTGDCGFGTAEDHEEWPVLAGGAAYGDADRDGMCDYWERAQGLSSRLADGHLDPDGDGYTNLEDFLDGRLTPSATASGPAPRAIVSRAFSRKGCDIELPCATVASEPRSGGVSELRIAFDVAPGVPSRGTGVTIEQRTCAAPAYVPYSGAATIVSSVEGNELVLVCSPALENGRTYRINLGPEVTSLDGQSVQVRGLVGDVNSDGRANAMDRSAWSAVYSVRGITPATDVSGDGVLNHTDRSIITGAWTGTERCAP